MLRSGENGKEHKICTNSMNTSNKIAYADQHVPSIPFIRNGDD